MAQSAIIFKADDVHAVYSMLDISHRWTIPIAADLLSRTLMPLRLQTEELKRWGLPFLIFLAHPENASERDFEIDHLFLSRDQNLIPLIWVWFNSYCFNLNKETSGSGGLSLDDPSVLKCFLSAGRGLCAARVAHGGLTFPPELNSSHSSPPSAWEALSFPA